MRPSGGWDHTQKACVHPEHPMATCAQCDLRCRRHVAQYKKALWTWSPASQLSQGTQGSWLIASQVPPLAPDWLILMQMKIQNPHGLIRPEALP